MVPLKTVNLPDELHRKVKVKAAEEGMTIMEIMEKLAQLYIDGKIEIPGD